MRAWLKPTLHAVLAVFTAVALGLMLFALGSLITAFTANASIDYGPAIDKAKDAAMVQSGLQDLMNKTQSYVEGKARRIVYSIVPERVANTALFVGMVVYKKNLNTPSVRDPLCPSLEHSVSADLSHAELTTRFHF